MFENSLLYKYVSRETLKRSEDKHIHFNSVLSRIWLYQKQIRFKEIQTVIFSIKLYSQWKTTNVWKKSFFYYILATALTYIICFTWNIKKSKAQIRYSQHENKSNGSVVEVCHAIVWRAPRNKNAEAFLNLISLFSQIQTKNYVSRETFVVYYKL